MKCCSIRNYNGGRGKISEYAEKLNRGWEARNSPKFSLVGNRSRILELKSKVCGEFHMESTHKEGIHFGIIWTPRIASSWQTRPVRALTFLHPFAETNFIFPHLLRVNFLTLWGHLGWLIAGTWSQHCTRTMATRNGRFRFSKWVLWQTLYMLA